MKRGLLILTLVVLVSCVPPAVTSTADSTFEAKLYQDELEACRPQGATCEQYVACRKSVAARHGRVYRGRC